MAKDTKFQPSKEAPYAAVASIMRFFELARMAKKPEKVDIGFLQGIGIEPGNAWALFPTLRFLGLMNAQSEPTENYQVVYLSGDDFTQGLRMRLEEAYSELLQKLDIKTATRQQLEQYFRVNFSPKLAARQTTAFMGLCRAAGLELPQATSREQRQTTASRPRQNAPKTARTQRNRANGKSEASSQHEREPELDLKAQYVASLIKRMESSSSADETKLLMDRIEALLGIKT